MYCVIPKYQAVGLNLRSAYLEHANEIVPGLCCLTGYEYFDE